MGLRAVRNQEEKQGRRGQKRLVWWVQWEFTCSSTLNMMKGKSTMYQQTAESKGPWTNGFVQRELEMTQIHEQKGCDSLSSWAELPSGVRAARGGMFSLTPSYLESSGQSAQVPQPWAGGLGRGFWVEPCPGVCQIKCRRCNICQNTTSLLPSAGDSWRMRGV